MTDEHQGASGAPRSAIGRLIEAIDADVPIDDVIEDDTEFQVFLSGHLVKALRACADALATDTEQQPPRMPDWFKECLVKKHTTMLLGLDEFVCATCKKTEFIERADALAPSPDYCKDGHQVERASGRCIHCGQHCEQFNKLALSNSQKLNEAVSVLQQHRRSDLAAAVMRLESECIAQGRVKADALAPPEPTDLERWRTFYEALAWMVNDYIGVCDSSTDFTQKDGRLGYAHEGFHNAEIVLRDKPPVPWEGQQHLCVCNKRERILHKHYDEPPYSCARGCGCKAYKPALPARPRADALAHAPEIERLRQENKELREAAVTVAELHMTLRERAEAAEQRLADALAPPEPQGQVVWLIERVQAMQINGKATYWSGDEELPPGGETTDPWDACWFPRKQDAARVAVGRFGKNLARSGWQIVEHVFSATPEPKPEKKQWDVDQMCEEHALTDCRWCFGGLSAPTRADALEASWQTAALLKDRTRRVIRERCQAGEAHEAIAADYGVPEAFVTHLAQWQLGADALAPPEPHGGQEELRAIIQRDQTDSACVTAIEDWLDSKLAPRADALAPAPQKGEAMELPDIEVVAAKVHEAWMETKRAQGIVSRPAADGTEQMVPYADLPDALQELDRATVRAVYAAIDASAK